MLQILNVVVSFFGAFEHFLKINQMSFALYMDFLFLCLLMLFYWFLCLSKFELISNSEFDFESDFDFGCDFDFGSDFGSDSLISLNYSMPTFSANSFGLF